MQSYSELKVLVVGDGNAGKTSLIKRLTLEKFDPLETLTQEIEISKWFLQTNDDPPQKILCQFWDFGGQEIMHATHQFFFSENTLYILVVDSRAESGRIEYWLKLIEVFGGDSPIIIVINKIDQFYTDLNRRGLLVKYPNIVAFVSTSARTGEGIETLKNEIIHQAKNIAPSPLQIAPSWLKVKELLEDSERNYISRDMFEQLLYEQGLDISEQEPLLSFLHNLGKIAFFNDPRLSHIIVLNPHWLIQGIYQIINSNQLLQSGGILELAQLQSILEPNAYPLYLHSFLVNVMEKFELSFELPEHDKYLVVDLLPREMPELDWPSINNCLNFSYRYDVLPPSIISRLIVRMNSMIDNQYYWRHGVVLADESNKALIVADIEDKKITISISGDVSSRREFLSVIRSNFREIHLSISRLNVTEVVNLPQDPRVEIEYSDLLTLERMNIREYFLPKLGQSIDVKNLLDGIVDYPPRIEKGRQVKLYEMITSNFNEEELKTISFYLGIDFDKLQGNNKSEFVMGLIEHIDRRGRLNELITLCMQERPQLSWQEIS